jgi:acetate CoA/acetoacetate CoA-transferase alpha subunit
VARVVASHIGTNPDTQKGLIEKTMQVDLVLQGTLVEQIRAKGHGLGGVLTKTGLGTIIADETNVVTLGGEQWLYAPPLRADFGFVYADRADMVGNLACHDDRTELQSVHRHGCRHRLCRSPRHRAGGRLRPTMCARPASSSTT